MASNFAMILRESKYFETTYITSKIPEKGFCKEFRGTTCSIRNITLIGES